MLHRVKERLPIVKRYAKKNAEICQKQISLKEESVLKALLVAGARPNFMKIAPICRAAQGQQHYDYAMQQTFFDDLELPEPDHYLEAGSGSHAEQTAKVMVAFETVCLEEKPDL